MLRKKAPTNKSASRKPLLATASLRPHGRGSDRSRRRRGRFIGGGPPLTRSCRCRRGGPQSPRMNVPGAELHRRHIPRNENDCERQDGVVQLTCVSSCGKNETLSEEYLGVGRKLFGNRANQNCDGVHGVNAQCVRSGRGPQPAARATDYALHVRRILGLLTPSSPYKGRSLVVSVLARLNYPRDQFRQCNEIVLERSATDMGREFDTGEPRR
jgi:hypothetical protein